MRWLVMCLFSVAAFAQQQVTPDDFNPKQAALFKKVTEAVSTPCCQNGIPVAYHASGMAQQVRDMVIKDIRAGMGERAIMDKLAELKMGPNKDMPLIFTVPDRNPLGFVFWWIGLLITLVLLGGVYWMLSRSKRAALKENEDAALLEDYRAMIVKQVQEQS